MLSRVRLHAAQPEAVAAGALRRPTMLDIVVLAIIAAFFAGAVAYVHACDRL
ncbi:hypothetical protein [Azospirillum sp. sgz302134]